MERRLAAIKRRGQRRCVLQRARLYDAGWLRAHCPATDARPEAASPPLWGAELENDLPTISADPGALNQVFLNLIKNAVDAFEDRPGKIVVRAESKGQSIQIEFRDNGPGIPESIRSQIFEPFFTTKSAGKGTGLGLSISRQIVENHGGSLEVNCPDSGGTVFVVSLPVSGSD